MRRFSWVATALISLMLVGASSALADKRVALLIGNQGYAPEVGRLSNPGNDVALLEGVLKHLGFDVTTVRDAGLASLLQAVNAHVRRVRQAGPDAVGFFYYSGHGAADGATNYLIPVDVKTIDDDQLWDQSLRLTEITRKLKEEAGNATHFVVFDACRNTLKLRKSGTKAIVQSRGFVPVNQESGMLIAYATAEGALASDVGKSAGPYATVLADEVVKPGFEAVAMFRNVQRRVRTASGQEPYLGFNALGDVYLAGKGEQSTTSRQNLSEASEAWDRTRETTSIAVLELYISSYKDTYYAGLARLRIDELKKRQVAVDTSPKAPAPTPQAAHSTVANQTARPVATADNDTVRKFGLFGTWAVDCSKPPSSGNTYEDDSPSETGYPIRTWYHTQGDRYAPTHTSEMRNVQIVGPDRLAYLDARKSDGSLTKVILAMIGNRLRSYEAIDPKDGKTYIKDGKSVDDGKPTELFEKCPSH
jgi:hypothetical protein